MTHIIQELPSQDSGTVGLRRCLNNVVGVCPSPFPWFCFALGWFHFQGGFQVLASGNSGLTAYQFSDVNVKSMLHSQLFQQQPWVDSCWPGHVTSLNQSLDLGCLGLSSVSTPKDREWCHSHLNLVEWEWGRDGSQKETKRLIDLWSRSNGGWMSHKKGYPVQRLKCHHLIYLPQDFLKNRAWLVS